jgi:general secretion pathway protein I
LPPIARFERPGANDGFTLIEALVALAIVALALTAIGAVVTVSSRGTRSLEQHLALVEITRMVLATLPAGEQIPPDGLAGEMLGYRWRIDVGPVAGGGIPQPADSPWTPRIVLVQVRSASGAVRSVETVRLLPRGNR